MKPAEKTEKEANLDRTHDYLKEAEGELIAYKWRPETG